MSLIFEKGYRSFSDIAGAAYGSYRAESYVGRISNACKELEDNINKFKGYETGIKQLKGDVQEFRSSGTFNINATISESRYKTAVDRSHGYASADITTNWGEEYGLKALYNGTASAKAQSISQFQRFIEYKSITGKTDLTFEAFLTERGLNPDTVLASDPIYSGQMRLIPSDQLEEAIAFLKKQIANKSITNPDEVRRYQDTLERLTTRIVAPDGTQSAEATTQELLDIAEKAKKGEYNAADDGFNTEQLVKIEHVLNQGIKAGLTAATITLVLKTAPEIYKCLDKLLSNGSIDEEQLKDLGFTALDSSTEGFIRGFVSATVTSSCSAGLWGETLKSVSPEVVGAMTVIIMNTLKDSFLLTKGTLTKDEFTYNLQRNIFVTACGLGGGAVLQTCLPMIPFAYLLGNFVGSMIGSFAFVAYDQAVLSYCVSSGSTFFGLVNQDYTLPDEVLKEVGVSLFEYEKELPHESTFNTYSVNQYIPNTYNVSFISILRRGVIGVRQIGYV